MLFLVTAFFFISYFPHLVLKIVAFVKKDWVLNMSFPGTVADESLDEAAGSILMLPFVWSNPVFPFLFLKFDFFSSSLNSDLFSSPVVS
jgi:hypothetical protein